MRRFFRIVLAVFAMSFMGHNVSAENADSIAIEIDSILATVDSVVADSVPEWYVAPEIPLSLRAPRRATASTPCSIVAAIRTYDINSQLTTSTYYEYDNAGRVISTTVWKHNSDGSQKGESKLEYGFDVYNHQISTVVYDWDNTMNIWHGVSRYEYVYDAEHRMLSNTEYAWINNEWKADTKYTWSYDAEGREAEYYAYQRDAVTNELVPVNGFIYTWLSDTQKSLEIIYTAYANNAWSAGTKKEWTFDASGNLTQYTESAISNGNWIGSSKETWTYGGPSGQLTLHEQFGWASSDWSKTLKEETEYSGAKITRIENYTYANGVPTGTKKETWTYGGPSGQLTLHEQFGWVSNDWSKTLKEETEYDGNNIIRIENYTYANGVPTGTKKELTTYTSGKKTQILTFAWENGDWANSNSETWTYGGPSGQLTKHEKCEWDGSDWTIMVQENTGYTNSNITLKENYERIEGVWTGTMKEKYSFSNGKKIQTIIYAWENGAWVESTKENWAYTNGKLTKHEFYEWTGDWTKTLEENTSYFGNNVSQVTNYALIEGVWTGTMNEQYAYTSGQKTSSIVYAWDAAASDWIEESREVWAYTSGKQTLYEIYEWYNNAWSVTLREKSGYDAAGNKNSIENYTGSEGVVTGTLKEEYTFNSAKEIVETIKYKWSEGIWEKDTKNEVGYTEGNTVYSEVNYTWDGSTWIGTGYKTSTTYIGDKVSEEWGYTWDATAGDWGYAAHRVVVYDTKNRLVGDTTFKYVNAAWEYYALQTHGYDSHDNDTLAITATWDGTEWVPTNISKGTYTYTAAGNPLLIESYTGLEGAWVGVQKIEWTYNAAGYQILYMLYEWRNSNWANKTRTQQSYDAANHLILRQTQNWSNNKWTNFSKYEYAFDEAGNQIMEAQYNGNGTSWVGFSRWERVYDENRRTIQYTSYSWRSNTWRGSTREEFTYDAQGRVIDYVQLSFRNNAWVNKLRTIYVYDLAGHTTSTRQYWWDNNQWSLYIIDDKEYDVSDNKLRRELSAEWYDGELDFYIDNYYFYDCDPHFYTIGFMNYDGSGLEYQTLVEGQTPEYNGASPTKPSTAESSYTFDSWSPIIATVTSDAMYIATFTETKNSYTITWKNEDGTLIDQTTAEYGTMPTHEDASKANTAEYTYTFAGWNPGLGIVTGDATYTATYTATKKNYTVTWQYKDGTEIDHATYAYGVIPTHADAEKAATAEWIYTFKGWTPGMGMVTGDATYTAEFDSIKNKYTIIFQNYDETELQRSEVEYGDTPEYEGTTPTKPADAQDTYNFAGWDPQVVPVTGTATYTAQYTSTVNSYTITFKNGNEVLQTSQVAYGEMPVYTGAKPTKDATAQYTYDFSGWDSEIVAVTGAKTYNAQFTSTVNKYVITFMNGEDILQTGEVAYGETPSYTGATPTKPADAQDTYTFAGWSPEIAAVTGTATYTATFTGTTNKYLITFKNGEEVLQSTEVDYGETPSYTGDTPTKPADAQYTYTFSGWDPQVVAVTGIATYEAQFNSTVNKYTIRFINDDDSELQSSEVEYGTEPVYAGATPTKDATAQYTYTFTGWDKEIASVTGDETYTAQFSSTVNSYTITWVDENDIEISHETLEYGATPSHADASKDNTAEWTYSFTGWSPAIVDVTGDATYKATFSQTKNSYTITWVDENDTEISHETLEYGATPSHADMSKDNTAEWTYNFEGWTPAIVDVTGDATYKATFSQTKNSYTVTWVDENDTEISHETLEYGATPSHADASKDNTAEWTYSFTGWTPAIVDVTGDATYTATFSATKNKYAITFVNYDGTTVLQSGEVEYGETPQYQGATPTKPADAEGTYTFAGWDEEIAAVTGAKTYTATFTGVKGTYTITFYFGDGVTILAQMELAYGEMPEMTLEPARLSDPEFSYTFAGWEPAIAPVTADADYVAVYTATTNSYTIIFRNDDGTELQRDVLEYGILPIYAGEEPTKEEDERYTYEFAGWKPAVDIAKADAVYTATYTATKKKKQGIEDVIESGAQATKIYIEGNIYILRAGHAYAPDGTKLY